MCAHRHPATPPNAWFCQELTSICSLCQISVQAAVQAEKRGPARWQRTPCRCTPSSAAGCAVQWAGEKESHDGEVTGMYGQWFGKSVEIVDTVPGHPGRETSRARLRAFLTRQGFRDITEADGQICACRQGGVAFSLIGQDPRRHAHRVEILAEEQAFRVRIRIRSSFSLGTKHDTGVFLAELDLLKTFLQTGELDDSGLEQAQARRRRSDFVTALLVFPVVAVMAVLLSYFVASVFILE